MSNRDGCPKDQLLLCGRGRGHSNRKGKDKGKGKGWGGCEISKAHVSKEGCRGHRFDGRDDAHVAGPVGDYAGGAEEDAGGFEHAVSSGSIEARSSASVVFTSGLHGIDGTSPEDKRLVHEVSTSQDAKGCHQRYRPQSGPAVGASNDELRPGGVSSVGAVKGFDNSGSSPSTRRPFDRRPHVIVGDIVKRSSRAGTPSERARRQDRWILFAGSPECLQEDVPGITIAGDGGGDGCHRFRNVSVLGALRRLRAVKRSGHSAIWPELHHGCSHEQRHGGGAGAFGSHDSSHRANSDGRWPLGAGLSVVADGGCSSPSVGQQDCKFPYWPHEIVCPSLPSKMGDDSPCLHQGNGLHQQSPCGCKEGSTSALASGCTKAEGSLSEGKRRRLRARARVGAHGLDGPFHRGIYEQEVVEEEDHVMWEPPLPAADPYGSRSLLGAVNYIFRSTMRSRCAFSFYVRCVLHCSHGARGAVATALFPIPLPQDGAWVFGLQRLGSSRRMRLARRRLVQLAIMAINYIHFRQPLKTLPSMQRRPGPVHQEIYARLIALSRAGGPVQGVSVLGCGRKSFQFGARFKELFEALQSLGLDSSSPYQQKDKGAHVDVVNDREELVPYRPLCAERLKISGRGQWDPSPYLSDLFYLPYMEPRCNEFDIEAPSSLRPDLSGVNVEEVMALCKKWDGLGLLELLPKEVGFPDQTRFVKVFNNYKSEVADRQIGDRRSQNYSEGRIPGPSSCLPTAAEILQVAPRRYQEILVTSITDRRDFYHQFQVSSERASRNAVFPWFRVGDFIGTEAYGRFREAFPLKRSHRRREDEGDYLLGRGRPRPLLVPDGGDSIACFKALFQGDHLGVEFACDSHSALLESHGLLREEGRLRSDRAIFDDAVVEGLVIDDYFVISKSPLQQHDVASSSASTSFLRRAKAVYQKENLAGSDDKDVIGELRAKVCGAQLDSSTDLVAEGVVGLGAPLEKRLALAVLSASSASLPYTTDAVHSSPVGSWISTMLLRRPCMSVFNEVFAVIPPAQLDTSRPRMWPLSRKAAEELLVTACLSIVMVSNLAVPFKSEVYATDASNSKGGIVSAPIPLGLSEVLWRTAERKAKNLPLAPASSAVLQQHDEMYEQEEEPFCMPAHLDFGEAQNQVGVDRPLGLRFQFLEVCGGSGVVTHELIALGVICGPILDLSYSRQYNLTTPRVVEWVLFMMEQGRLDAHLVAPPCTTFSAAAFPPVRSYKNARGFNPKLPKVWLGNRLAFASITLIEGALRFKKFGLGEQPRRSKMRWLREWQAMLKKGAREAVVASCAFGSFHQKEFVFVGANMLMEKLERLCARDHSHVPIQGKFTRPSSVYVPKLAKFLAAFIKSHLDALEKATERCKLRTEGLEDVLSNDVLASAEWKEESSWPWSGKSHINVLETAAVIKLFKKVALGGGDCRLTYFIDSHVAKSALCRGRSASSALRPLLRRACSWCLAFGLYPAGRFAPTRANPADHPTRCTTIPPPVPCSLWKTLDFHSLSSLAQIQKLRRWASNWARLVLLSSSLSSYLHQSYLNRRHAPFPISLHEWALDFDSTLGFPGEGLSFQLGLTHLLLLLSGWAELGCRGVESVAFGASHGDVARMKSRAGIELSDGRRVSEGTSATRAFLLAGFQTWLEQQGTSFDDVALAKNCDLDVLNSWLVKYGRWLFAVGKPYYFYSETINAVSVKRPILRRAMQQAWDLAFMWHSHEPTEHHIAMPHQILLAILSTAFAWGWKREAGIFALAWGAILRIGEVLQSYRKDLIVPADVDFSLDHVLLKIREPKTRFKAARTQTGKLEQLDLIQVVTIGLGSLRKGEMLWPFSGSTLRLRLKKILQRLHLPHDVGSGIKPLTLASFRPGGATYLISKTDAAETVRRRGRWISLKVMETYLQEVTSATYMNEISTTARKLVILGCKIFPELLQKAMYLNGVQIPEQTWFFLFSCGHLRQQAKGGKVGWQPKRCFFTQHHTDDEDNGEKGVC